jgi:hypothetical protein
MLSIGWRRCIELWESCSGSAPGAITLHRLSASVPQSGDSLGGLCMPTLAGPLLSGLITAAALVPQAQASIELLPPELSPGVTLAPLLHRKSAASACQGAVRALGYPAQVVS